MLRGLWAGALSGAALAALPGTAGVWMVAAGAVLGAALGAGLRIEPRSRPRMRSEERSHRLAPLLLGAFFIPVITKAVAPGVDVAMHVALARGLLEHTLSPAWPGVQVAVYPRGFSALVALLSPIGIARAGLLAASISYVVFCAGLAATLDRLGTPWAWPVAAVAMFVSRMPQIDFDWGLDPSVLALGLAMLAAAALDGARGGAFAGLLMAGAVAVHPMSAAFGALVVAAVGASQRAWTASALAALGLGGALALLTFFGPHFSPREIAWVHDYALRSQEVVPLRRLGAEMGDPAAIATGLAAAVLLWKRAFRPVALAAVSIVALGALFPLLPAAGLYQMRFTSLLLIPAAALWGRAAAPWPPALALALAAAVPGHLRWYQRAIPIATSGDVRAMACVAQTVPQADVIDGAYGDGTQWIPALAGRAVTRPHQHVSLLDESDAALKAMPKPRWRFVGERLRYPPPIGPPPPGAPLCDGHLYPLQ